MVILSRIHNYSIAEPPKNSLTTTHPLTIAITQQTQQEMTAFENKKFTLDNNRIKITSKSLKKTKHIYKKNILNRDEIIESPSNSTNWNGLDCDESVDSDSTCEESDYDELAQSFAYIDVAFPYSIKSTKERVMLQKEKFQKKFDQGIAKVTAAGTKEKVSPWVKFFAWFKQK